MEKMNYKKQGKTLVDAIHDIYEKHGYFLNELMNFTFEGQDGMNKMQEIMERLRNYTPTKIAGFTVIGWSDYKTSKRLDGTMESEITLPKSNVLEYRLENGSKLIVRPSGTEPKLKLYLSVFDALYFEVFIGSYNEWSNFIATSFKLK